jgi:hypothetical protein
LSRVDQPALDLLATAAHTVGALGLIEKPLRALDVIAVVNTALARETAVSAPDGTAAVAVGEPRGRTLTTQAPCSMRRAQ